MAAQTGERQTVRVVNRALMGGGAALVAIGGILCMAGGLAVTAAVIGASRSWLGRREEPPRAGPSAG